ncbi:MAG: FCD domain-containing protein [Spirochaetota bacterium]
MEMSLFDRELLLLDIIKESEEPVGSGYLVAMLEDRGVNISQATVGRLLYNLERYGYVEKLQNKGRVITAEGDKAINEALTAKEINAHKQRLDELLNSKVLNNFLMILEARKAIERATVRLAAEHVTDEELHHIEKLLEKKEEYYKKKIKNSSVDVEFHSAIAKASRNEVLEMLYHIISRMGQQSDLFEDMRNKAGGAYITSHSDIVDALKAHDPDKAEQSLISHIELLKKDVLKYWDAYNPE